MTVLANNGNATYDEAIRASVVQLQADLRATAMEFGNRAGDEFYMFTWRRSGQLKLTTTAAASLLPAPPV